MSDIDDPRIVSLSIDFMVESRVVFPGVGEAWPAPDFPSSTFDRFTLTYLLRTNRAVQIIKEDGTVITYSMKNRPVIEYDD